MSNKQRIAVLIEEAEKIQACTKVLVQAATVIGNMAENLQILGENADETQKSIDKWKGSCDVHVPTCSTLHFTDIFLAQENLETKSEETTQKRKVAFCEAPKASSSTR
eukprot:746707-Hanusia_phi.AAC.2